MVVSLAFIHDGAIQVTASNADEGTARFWCVPGE